MTIEELLKNILDELTPREQKIIKLRYGLEDGETHTLEEVGQEFGVTRARIRQIEEKALAKAKEHHGELLELLRFSFSFHPYRCLCGKYWRKRYIGIVCDKCGTEVMPSQMIIDAVRKVHYTPSP